MAGQPPLVKNLMNRISRGTLSVDQLCTNLRAAQTALDDAQASDDPAKRKKIDTYTQAVAAYSIAVMKCGKKTR